MAPSSSTATTSVQVALRIRPATTQDSTSIPARFQRAIIHANSSTSVIVDGTSSATPSAAGSSTATATASPAGKKQVFSFDQVHPPAATQHTLFTSTAQPLISRFVEGFNCTILAYGQTSSGKTFTMTGVDLDADPSDPTNGMGIIPRAVSTIFSRAKQLKEERGGAWSYSIKSSFIEIYNEDLIDLLSLDDTTGARREVQIREDKDGHIIWGGLREVNVRNASEVMTLLRKGTSIRRTNETDMNAQSSRSHAIFSLTLTQKKYSGSGPPPRSPSPLPPNGRSPSRLARPGSMYAGSSPGSRIASPTFGRPSTPNTFQAAMGRGGGLRPSSALGLRSSELHSSPSDDEPGEWVTIISKFHFVDLAGSERLKRTAAAGERIKEGISINSGLLALGNVISALGDPSRAKSHTASHVPYRDSKLTRLLQDSLGGNAHTLMIACVSPAEWNAGETVNTLKYANRARNIKNRAVVNEKEDGWDDVEWLQGTVTRLRKELKGIKDGGPITTSASSEVLEGAGKKVLAQMTDLQNNYEDLREKFVERTEELTRLRRELGERQRGSTGGAVGGTGKYEEIVGPVIEEYEKTIAAMEAELNLNRAALRHTNEMVEEKEDELALITERHSATELYVEELRSRVLKLTEREASTEAYVRDLEEKIKTYDDTSISSSESMTDLKREVARYKDTESHSTKYIADLEARLSSSDESIIALQQTIEKLEKESERRRGEVEILQFRLDALQHDGQSWRTDLEERERKVRELEEKLEEWERRRQDAGEDRARLGNVVEEVEHARRSLEVLVTPSNGRESGATTPNGTDIPLESQLLALQQTHTATLADLSSVTSKYRDALREISDLASQIQEAKLHDAQLPDTSMTIPESPAVDRPLEIPPFKSRRPRTREGSEPQISSPGKRLFFRQAASTESLHARSLSQSQSLSQELSLARSRKASISSHGTSSSLSFSASTSHSPSNSHSTSTLNSALNSRPNLLISLPAVSPSGAGERSVTSLEKEIMRLQEVLKEREAEISALEESLRGQTKDGVAAPLDIPHQNGLANGHAEAYLSPKTMHQFDHIRKAMETEDHTENSSDRNGSVSETDESLDRLNELMLSMAQKESQHREIVEKLNEQLVQVRRQHDDLTTLSRDQAVNMSSEMEALRAKHAEDLEQLAEVEMREAELKDALQQAINDHTAAVRVLQDEHEEALRVKGAEVDDLLARVKQEHDVALSDVRSQLSQASDALSQAHRDHEEAFGKLKADHEEEMKMRIKEVKGALSQSQEDHVNALDKLRDEHQSVLKQRDAEATTVLQRTEEEYYNALTKLRGDHAEALAKQSSEAAANLERLREEHASESRIQEIARQGSLSESQSSQALAMQELQEEHAAAMSRKETSLAEELASLRAEHTRALSTKDDDYRLQMKRLRAEHEVLLTRLREEFRIETEKMNLDMKSTQQDSAGALAKSRSDMEASMQALQEQQASVLQEVERGHEEDIAHLKSSHSATLKETEERLATYQASVVRSHTEATAKLKAEHQQALTEVNSNVMAAQEKHRQELEELRARSERAILEERERLAATLADLERRHSEERETLSKEHDLLIQELETHKAATDEFAITREESRRAHENALNVKAGVIKTMEQQVSTLHGERDTLKDEAAQLRAELERTRSEQSKLIQEASKRQSLVDELERHRSVLAETQENLQKVKDEKDTLQLEKNRQDSLVRDLQAQIARSASPPGQIRPVPDRNMSYTRATGLPAIKLPPPTPPPSVPPPPAPRSAHLVNGDGGLSTSSQASSAFMSTSSKDSQLDSPVTSVGPPSSNGHATPTMAVDPKTIQRLEQQSKQIDEQEAMIKTLNKQLTHCESDLQTHMDLVSTLESSLGDSEKNLRKARMLATELARERDSLSSQIDNLRNELQDAKREVVSVRRSVVEEKQSLEQRLDEERKAKERARAQLDTRMEELQRRKSKFACL